MRFLGFSNHEKGAPRQEISKWSTVCNTFLRSGWSVVRSASLAKGGTSKKRPSPHLHKVPTRSNKISPRTLQTALVISHYVIIFFSTQTKGSQKRSQRLYFSSHPSDCTFSQKLATLPYIRCINGSRSFPPWRHTLYHSDLRVISTWLQDKKKPILTAPRGIHTRN
jgi:hypothetical protein